MIQYSTWKVGNEEFDLDSSLRVVDYLGEGAYGVVCQAVNDQSHEAYAIKKCKNVFHSRTIAKRTLRELRLLALLRHDNVVQIKSIQRPHDPRNFSNIFIMFELMVNHAL